MITAVLSPSETIMASAPPLLQPPHRLGHVNAGLLRGAYPTLRNFRALSRMQLRTIVSLTPEPPTADLRAFAEVAGITCVHIPVQRTTAVGPALQASLVAAINVCIDADNLPVYVHCLDGRRITGLVVLLLRRLQGWLPLAALAEYWRYQASPRQQQLVNLTEVEKSVREIEKFASEAFEVVVPERVPTWLWAGNRGTTKLAGVRLKHVPPLVVPEPSFAGSSGGGSGSNSGSNGGSISSSHSAAERAEEESLKGASTVAYYSIDAPGGGSGGGTEPYTLPPKDLSQQLSAKEAQDPLSSFSSKSPALLMTASASRALSALDLHGFEAATRPKKKGL